MIIDWVWVGNWINWINWAILQIIVAQRNMFLVTVFTALLADIFQQLTFLCFRTHVLAG
jgi:hypothetical protein